MNPKLLFDRSAEITSNSTKSVCDVFLDHEKIFTSRLLVDGLVIFADLFWFVSSLREDLSSVSKP